MAVKPWIGAIKEPDNHPPVNKDAPDSGYAIDYVYGYRCQDSRQNVYFNPEGNIVYITACLGVILDKASNTQKFFGGGNVENKSKQVASDANHHNNDVMCMKINTNGNREWAVSGQVGKSPSIFVWNTLTGEKRQRMNLLKGSRAVAACAISTDLKYIACADKHNDHNVFVFEVDSGSMVYTEKGGPDEIFDMAFNMAEGQYDLWSAGMKHMTYWNIAEMKKKKCVFGENPRTSFAACTADDQGNCYAGGSNSLIYVWCKNSLKTTIGVHNRGFVGLLSGTLVSSTQEAKTEESASLTQLQELARTSSSVACSQEPSMSQLTLPPSLLASEPDPSSNSTLPLCLQRPTCSLTTTEKFGVLTWTPTPSTLLVTTTR